MNRLILFTRQYPFGVQESFLDTEIPYLAQGFNQVLIFPNECGSGPRDVPVNVAVDTTFSLQRLGIFKTFFRALPSISLKLWLQEFRNNFKHYLSPRAFWRSLMYFEEAHRVQRLFNKLIENEEVNLKKTVFYTYWLRGQAFGVSLIKEEFPQLVFISRAHGGDIYEERHEPPYLPFRNQILKKLDRIFPISQHGLDYLQNKYSEELKGAEIARLGVRDPGFRTSSSKDGVIRIASCSSVIKLKRLDLIIASLSAFIDHFPDQKIAWDHLGDGPLKGQMIDLAHRKLADKMPWLFHGQLSHQQVMEYYRSQPVDLFLNLSSSEGIPVSIMEAQSCGIPVVAAAVGGIPEIVSNRNGVLLPAHPKPELVAKAIFEAINDSADRRNASRENWHKAFHADHNFQEFVTKIKKLTQDIEYG